jgi:hypothetical protein
MDQIVRLNRHQEAMLDDAADRFIALHKGDVRKALKEMMVLNRHLQDRLDLETKPELFRRRAMG